jgi:hypothetical protein
MAKIRNGITGQVIGSVASITAASWKGINYIRERVPASNPNTVPQQRQRLAYKYANNVGWLFSKALKTTLIEPYLARNGIKLTWQMDWIKRNIGKITENINSRNSIQILDSIDTTDADAPDTETDSHNILTLLGNGMRPIDIGANTAGIIYFSIAGGFSGGINAAANTQYVPSINTGIAQMDSGDVQFAMMSGNCAIPGDWTTYTDSLKLNWRNSNVTKDAWTRIINRIPGRQLIAP